MPGRRKTSKNPPHTRQRRKRDKAGTLLPLMGVLCLFLGAFVFLVGMLVHREDPRLTTWLIFSGIYTGVGLFFFLATYIFRRLTAPKPIYRKSSRR